MKLWFAVSLLVATALAKNSYVVVSPSKIRANMDLSISVNILNATSNVNVKAILQQGSSEIVRAAGVFSAGKPGNLFMKLPATLSGHYYTLKVVGSGGLSFTNQRSLQVNKKQYSIFIQTDKGMYKPGDKVNFRSFAVYPDLSAFTEPVDILVYDGQANKIKQWLQQTPTNGVITKSISLSSQPVLGDWKIQVKTKVEKTEKIFKVAEYVLPKFEVNVEMPSYAATSDKEVTFKVKAKYTYGKPVSGKADVWVTLDYNYDTYGTRTSDNVLHTVQRMDGETTVTVPMATLKALTSSLNKRVLKVVTNVTESLTGNLMTASGKVTLYDSRFKLDFPKTNPETFKPGLEYTAYLKISQQDGLPVSPSLAKVSVDTLVTVQDKSLSTYYNPVRSVRSMPTMQLSVPDNGLVAIPVDIPSDADEVTVTAKYNGIQEQLKLKKSYSPSSSYIQMSLKSSGAIQAGDMINFEVKATQPVDQLVYQVMSRGALGLTGKVNGNHQTSVSFALRTRPSMAPNARIVVYYVRADGEIVTDSLSFDINGAFKNKVDVSFNKNKTEPGNKVQLTVKADPGSNAHLLAIDQSVLLLRSGNDVTTTDVYSELKAYDTIKDNEQNDVIPLLGGGIRPAGPIRRKRSIWWPFPISYGGSDATKIFQNAGVVVITDALLYQHREPIPRWPVRRLPEQLPRRRGWGWSGPRGMVEGRPRSQARFNAAQAFQAPQLQRETAVDMPKQPKKLAEVERVRVDFTESWLWLNQPISGNGTATVETTVPDTITSWVASAFAFNNRTGLGLAPNQAHLTVFRPFFVSLNLPYSVTNGEQLALQAIVFNYLDSDAQVRVTLTKSKSFMNIFVDNNGVEGTKQEDAVQDVLVKSGEAKSVYFPIVPIDLGKIDVEVKAQSTRAADAVRRQLLVEPEGVPKEFNVPVLVELTNGKSSFTKTVDLSLPPNVVSGSELLRVSVVGDLMGPSIAGLDSLLRMPTGCGEQTMLGLAPDVYITDYLNAVQQLQGDIAEKALNYMESGYQRELTYKHSDHSFSAFGDNDASGSMWLTAFVVKVFHQASSHIYVDDDVITRAVNWMLNKQNLDGSFPEPGRVIHKSMQGKAGSGTALTLFVFISLMENKDLFATGAYATKFESARTKALTYLEAQMVNEDDPYNLALAAYAFQLAGSSKAQSVLNKLEQKATVKDGLKYWHYPQTTTSTSTATWHRPNPAKAIDTEMTSYVLLTYAARRDLINGKSIMQWVVQQRNPNGGFSSTQDTVVALNALSEFNRLVYGDKFQVHITATLDRSTKYDFDIDKTNSLVLQTRESTTVPAQVKIDATGSGVVLANVAVFFNVPSEVEETTFHLSLHLEKDTLNQLTILVCTRWMGEGSASGMAVAEIGIPSGFEADRESITQVKLLKRVEYENKKVILYFDEINRSELCVDLTAVRTGLVAKSQPAAVRVYDYYEPGNQVTAFYQSQILKDSTVCDVCSECENCVNRRG